MLSLEYICYLICLTFSLTVFEAFYPSRDPTSLSLAALRLHLNRYCSLY